MLKQFYNRDDQGFKINPQQASSFAKNIADDFNPIHDPDAKRFCVPGDLLFALVLDEYGLYQKMRFTFSGMVGAGANLIFPENDGHFIEISDDKGKICLQVEHRGTIRKDPDLTEKFIRAYVAFSGHNFPDILVPLMARHGVMINTDRPLVIYEGMSFEMDHLNFSQPELELSSTSFEIKGKRGAANISFHVKSGKEVVGTGIKKLIVSGLREYEQNVIQEFTDAFLARKERYVA